MGGVGIPTHGSYIFHIATGQIMYFKGVLGNQIQDNGKCFFFYFLSPLKNALLGPGDVCHLGNRNVLLHVLHALHILHILPVESHHALHDFEVPSLLAVKTRKTRAQIRVKEVVNAITMLLLHVCMAYDEMLVKDRNKKN